MVSTYRNRYNLINCGHKEVISLCFEKRKVPDQTISTIVLHKAVIQICRLIKCHCLAWLKFAVAVPNLVHQKYYTCFYSLAGNMEIFLTNLNVSFGFANRMKYNFIGMRGRIWCFFHIN